MISEEKIKELETKVAQQKEENTKEYLSLADEAEKIKQDFQGVVSSIQTLKDLTTSEEITNKISEKEVEKEQLAETYNEKYKKLVDLEKQIFVSDGVVQACKFILQEDEYAEK